MSKSDYYNIGLAVARTLADGSKEPEDFAECFAGHMDAIVNPPPTLPEPLPAAAADPTLPGEPAPTV